MGVRPTVGGRLRHGSRGAKEDFVAIGALATLLAILSWNRSQFDAWLASFDTLSFYLPVYGHLGERLRALDVPAWNPSWFSGMPFAGDPQSGWTYLPAMVGFALLPPVAAFKLMVIAQLVIGSLSTYVLARVLGMAPVAALTAGVIYAYGPFIHWGAGDGTVMAHVATWIPLALLGAELVIRSAAWTWRVTGAWLGAIAVSQILAGWIGQGAVYALLAIIAYIGYRALLSPPMPGRSFQMRFAVAVSTGGATLGLGIGLAAAGLVPRMLAVNQTTLSDGYEGLVGTGATYPPMDVGTLLYRLLADGRPRASYAFGGAVVVLALLAAMLARRRWSVPYFTGLTAVTLIMTLAPTPLHSLFYLLPRFQDLHEHDPWHVLVLLPIGASMLAAATVQSFLLDQERQRMLLALGATSALFIAVVAIASQRHAFIGWPSVSAGVAALGVIAATMVTRGSKYRPLDRSMVRTMPALLLIVLVVHLGGLEFTGSWFGWPRDETWASYWSADPARDAAIAANAATADPGGAGEFLQARRDAGEVFRYVGYGGFNNPDDPERWRSHMTWRLDPRITALLVNGRPHMLELEEIQGYNPVQLRRYAEFITAINDVRTNYHILYLLPGGAKSPLLSLLNLRYVVIDRSLPPQREDVLALISGRIEVFRNDLVSVYEDLQPPPQAWIVHEAETVTAGEALPRLLDGGLDPQKTALIEGELPPLGEPESDAVESVRVVTAEPDRLVLEVTAVAPGVLVVSEIYEPGWRATLDGASVAILPTNHILQGVALPAGTHTIELRYAPPSLRIGLLVTALTVAALVASITLLVLHRLRRHRGIQIQPDFTASRGGR